MPASPVRKLVPFAIQAKQKGLEVFHLNIGQPDIPTPAQFFEGIKLFQDKVLAYENSRGNEALRREGLGRLQRVARLHLLHRSSAHLPADGGGEN